SCDVKPKGLRGRSSNTHRVTDDPALEGFLALLAARRAPRTVEAYRRDLRSLAEALGRPVASATREDLEPYIAELRAAGLSPATVARRVAAIRPLFRHQVLLGSRDDNPAAGLGLPRRTRRPPPTPPARAVPDRPRRGAHAERRVPDPAPARREGGTRSGAHPPAPSPPLVRDAPARGRRRPAQRPGDARACGPRDHRALHPRFRPPT